MLEMAASLARVARIVKMGKRLDVSAHAHSTLPVNMADLLWNPVQRTRGLTRWKDNVYQECAITEIRINGGIPMHSGDDEMTVNCLLNYWL